MRPLSLAALLALLGSCTRTQGVCRLDADCDSGLRCCAGACRDVTSDPEHCGNCGAACGTANATPSCMAGVCELACFAGFGNCNGSPGDGCETVLAEAVDHCGRCANACSFHNAGATCAGGHCAMAECAPDYADCDEDPGNGCEVSLKSAADHCGGCGKPCTPPQATGACVGGACRVSRCEDGYGDCNGDPADGCETDLESDPRHCGFCPIACEAGQGCFGGQCKGLELLVYGGFRKTGPLSSQIFRLDLGTHELTEFIAAEPQGAPAARAAHAAFFDPSTRQMFIWGGFTGTATYDTEVWSLDLRESPPAWKRLATTGGPPGGRGWFGSGYDAASRKFYVFGGWPDQGKALGDLWVLDIGTATWTRLSATGASNAPAARGYPAAAFDRASGTFVVFGGTDDAGNTLGDLWAFDPSGSGWKQLTVAGAPAARSSAQLFDGSRPLLLFGGHSKAAPNNDAYDDQFLLELSPPRWTPKQPTPRPLGRFFAATAAAGETHVLWGGQFNPPGGSTDEVLTDIWMHDGLVDAWTELVPTGPPTEPGWRWPTVVLAY